MGKARILRRRVLSYFRPEGLPAKTRAMLAHAASLDYLTTTTEKEALLLEASLIKKYRPHYNIVLRDDKQYVLFRLNLKHAFPRLETVRRARRDGARYFGPFTSALGRTRNLEAHSPRFCPAPLLGPGHEKPGAALSIPFYGPVPAPCMGLITPQVYHEAVHKVCELLQGRAVPLLREPAGRNGAGRRRSGI